MADIQDLLNTDAAFTCARQPRPVKMLKRACVVRQDKAARMVTAGGFVKPWQVQNASLGLEKCIKCEDGTRIRAEIEDKPTHLPEVLIKTEEKSMSLKEGEFIKKCQKCGELKLCSPDSKASQFHKHPHTTDKYDNRCKACKKIMDQERREKEVIQKSSEATDSHTAASRLAPIPVLTPKLETVQAEAAKETPAKEAAPSPAGEPEAAEARYWRDSQLLLDFSEYPEVLAKVKAAAKDQIRTPEGQVLFVLRTLVTGATVQKGA